jgi:hypothetical protein
MAEKRKLQSMVSPVGIASWPRLQSPDFKFKKLGEYTTGLLLPLENAETTKFLAELQKAYDAAVEQMAIENPKSAKKGLKKADPPFANEVDAEGNPTGNVVLHFKMAARVEPKDKSKEGWNQRPDLFDAKLNPLPANGPRIGGGSSIRVSFQIMPFFAPVVGAGISLRMQGVQVLNAVEFAPRSATSLGFGATDGYDSTAEVETDNSENGAGAQEDDGADDEAFN